MKSEIEKPQSAQEQLADLNQTLEKEKVQLTPEVEEYVRKHIRAIQDKLQAGEDVYESELEFIKKVKMWVMMPKEWREKYKSVEEMMKNQKLSEANKRHISVTQWQDLLHVAEASGNEKEWIDKTFQFPGDGKIKVEKDLELGGSTELKKLPEGLSVGESLFLRGCTGLTKLPEGLEVYGYLNLDGCTGLTELPEGLKVGGSLFLTGCTELTELPEGLKVGWSLFLTGCTGLTELPEGLKVGESLDLEGCTGLTELPEGLQVGRRLDLTGCTGLTELPEGLQVGGNLSFDAYLNKQVAKDVERLKKAGKIKGKIAYQFGV